jgi:hypothetical protein
MQKYILNGIFNKVSLDDTLCATLLSPCMDLFVRVIHHVETEWDKDKIPNAEYFELITDAQCF